MASEDRQRDRTGARELAWTLALGGFIPFAAFAGAMVLAGPHHPWSIFAIDGFKTWSAVILSFLGGIRWGMALRHVPVARARLAVSVAAAIIGWLAVVAPDRIGIAVLLVAHCGQGAWDSLSVQRGEAPQWFGPLRIVLTLLVAAAHVAAFIAIS